MSPYSYISWALPTCLHSNCIYQHVNLFNLSLLFMGQRLFSGYLLNLPILIQNSTVCVAHEDAGVILRTHFQQTVINYFPLVVLTYYTIKVSDNLPIIPFYLSFSRLGQGLKVSCCAFFLGIPSTHQAFTQINTSLCDRMSPCINCHILYT